MGYETVEARKTFFCVKGEHEVDHTIFTRWFKKFRSGCKDLNDWARSGRSVLQAIEPNSASSLASHNTVEFITFKTLAKSI